MDIKTTFPQIDALTSTLLRHKIYREVNSLDRLRWFMADHVFAVWDFMSLAKRLQQELSCTDVPWTPRSSPMLTRFINDIVLAEESDINHDGQEMSHLSMYLSGMQEVGADSSVFRDFLYHLQNGDSYAVALEKAKAPEYVRDFVSRTLNRAINGTPVEVAADFLFGREDAIPEMFQALLSTWNLSRSETRTFSYYLQRHIDLDGKEHGPAARHMLETLAGQDQGAWHAAARAATHAIQSRIDLWDGVLNNIRHLESMQARSKDINFADVKLREVKI